MSGRKVTTNWILGMGKFQANWTCGGWEEGPPNSNESIHWIHPSMNESIHSQWILMTPRHGRFHGSGRSACHPNAGSLQVWGPIWPNLFFACKPLCEFSFRALLKTVYKSSLALARSLCSTYLCYLSSAGCMNSLQVYCLITKFNYLL